MQQTFESVVFDMHLVQYAAKESETLRMVGIVRNDVIIECISGTLVELVNEENGFETLTRSSNNKKCF
jgi:hypothetical protein